MQLLHIRVMDIQIRLLVEKVVWHYEIRDMEEYVTNLSGEQNLEYIQDVRDVLTQVQKVWGKYE